MKRFLALALALCVYLLPREAQAEVVLLNAVTTTGASTAQTANTSARVRVKMWNSGGTFTATIRAWTGTDSSSKTIIYTFADTDNAALGDVIFSGVSHYDVNLSACSGCTFSATAEAFGADGRQIQ